MAGTDGGAQARTKPLLITDAPCPGIFYAFGASYPDGVCHDGHIDDADTDRCYVDFDYRPCPYCRNDEYQQRLREGGHFMPPFGYINVVRGDYFAMQPKSTKKRERRACQQKALAHA